MPEISENFRKIMQALETVKLSKIEIDLLCQRVEELLGYCHAPQFDKAYLSSTLSSRRTHSANRNASAKFLKHMERDPDYQVLLNIKKQMKVRNDLIELNRDLLNYPDNNELMTSLQIKLEPTVSLKPLVDANSGDIYLLIKDRFIIRMGESKVICQQGTPFYRKRRYELIEKLTSTGIQITLSSVDTEAEIISHTVAHLIDAESKEAVNQCF